MLTPTLSSGSVPALVRPSPGVVAFWTRVQHCEEPVTGWQTRGSTYEGGVGFYVGTWASWARQLGVYARYPHAWMAPAWVQIAVAEYGYRHGGYWGCLHE